MFNLPRQGAAGVHPFHLISEMRFRLWNRVFMALSLLFGVQNLSAQSQPQPEDLVNALNDVFGRHAKQRGSHAKGFCVAGYFVPSTAGKDFSTTPLLQGTKIPVTARFSIGGGNPHASDKGRSVRGLAVRFHLADGEELDLVMISAPVFFAATPAQFVEFLKVRTPDSGTGKKNPTKIKAFNHANPNVMPHLDYVSKTPPPASYATTPYFSTHAFFFEKRGDQKQAARWVLEPKGGFQGLTAEQERDFPNSFLEKEIVERLKRGAAEWEIYLQIPQAGDSLIDPSAVWPDSRKKINIGRLVIDLIEKRWRARLHRTSL